MLKETDVPFFSFKYILIQDPGGDTSFKRNKALPPANKDYPRAKYFSSFGVATSLPP